MIYSGKDKYANNAKYGGYESRILYANVSQQQPTGNKPEEGEQPEKQYDANKKEELNEEAEKLKKDLDGILDDINMSKYGSLAALHKEVGGQ